VTFSVPTTRFAFTDRRLVRIVEPGDVEVWVASHSAASTSSARAQDSTGGAITNQKAAAGRELQGSATARAVVAIEGEVHEVTVADARLVEAKVVPA